MLNGLFGPHAGNLQRSMDRASERHALLTENLANVNTPGYKRQDVDFSIELERARQPKAAQNGTDDLETQPRGIIDRDGSVRVDGNSVDMEAEVVALAETEIRYQTLAEMSSRYFSGLKSVIREGR